MNSACPSTSGSMSPATPQQKNALKALGPEQLGSGSSPASRPRGPHQGARQRSILWRYQGRDRAGWFAARPSGTEDVYKIYAESFRDRGPSEADPERSATRHCQGVLTMRRLAAMLALMFLISGAACAEPVFSFDSTPGKLPKTVVPIRYSIELKPDSESSRFPASKPSISTCGSPPRGSR